jgi:hypothetical protein
MRKRQLALLAALSLAGAAPVVVSEASASGPQASAACTHARIDGKSKCIARGQFCKHSVASQYRKYGYKCNKKDRNGRWHLT